MPSPSTNGSQDILTDPHTQLSAERQKLLLKRLKEIGNAPVEAPKIPKRVESQRAPLSFAQRQMWIIDQVNPGNPAYHIPVAYRIHGELDVQALETSFNKIIERHEIWRTTFCEFEGEAIQEIHPEGKIQIGVIDLTHLPENEREARVAALASEESNKAFDLGCLPLVRVSLIKLSHTDNVLLIDFHHIVGDGLSLNIVFDELDAFYEAALSGTTPRPPNLTIQYGDFAAWQSEAISGGKHASQLDFWKERLSGSLPILDLPLDKSRPLMQSFNGGTIDFPISLTLAESLTAIARQENCTFFAAIFAAFQILLARYSTAEELIIGTPVADRPLRETDRLIGNFVNMVALRCDLSGNPTYIELLRRCKAATLDALSNKDLPFEMVVHALKPARDPSRNPIFQAMLQILPAVRPRLGNLSVSPFEFEQKSAQVDLTLHLYEQPAGGFLGRFQYCSALFDVDAMERLAANFCRLLDEIAKDPFQKVLEIPILSESEKSRVLLEWNQTGVDYALETTLHALFEKQAASTPDSVAVDFEGRHLSYRELDHRANQLGNRLRSLGVGPNILVGVSVERSLELVIGLLAILKAGGAYVPIDPGYPLERRAFMMQDASVPVLLTQQSLLTGLPPHSAQVICVDKDWAALASESDASPVSSTGDGDLAYMIYTSGSTGRPKGALNLHRGIVNRLLWMQDRYRLTPADHVLQKTPFSFDVSVWEFFWPLINGARLVVARPGGHQDPAYLIRLIKDRQITILHFVPSMLRIFLDEPGVSDGKSLRHVICSGEALPHDLQEKFFALLPCQLHNLYGPTEAAVDVTHWTCQRDGRSTVVPIGRPVANTQCYILNPQLQPVPIGAPGELHLGGVQVGNGYYNRPGLTAEKFIPDPFRNESGARLYKTGDLCRFRADGVIEYLGRLDHQVKLRGFRIELGEIEELLRHDDEVREAAVVLREDHGEKRLAAYCVAIAATATASGEDRQRLAANLSSSLRAKLPEYMLPSIFIFLERLPVSANGKLDARALPVPAWNAHTRDAECIAPRTMTEERVAQAWREILKLPRVGVDEDFFALGGHSLLAIRLIGRLREEFGIPIPTPALFDSPTVQALAGLIDRHALSSPRSKALSSLIPIRRGSKDRRPLFLVPGGWGGEIEFLAYGTLNSHMDPDQPLFGLRARGADGSETPHASVMEMAEAYAAEIRTAQATGPYMIAGECIGGLLAYEIARVLESQQQRVDPLILLDTEPPSKANAREFKAKERSERWRAFLEVQICQPAKGHWRKLSRLSLGQKISYIAARVFRRRRPAPENSSPLDERKLLSHYPPMLMTHALKPYSGLVTLILSEKVNAEGNFRGWSQVPTGGLDIHVVPGDHHSYIREHAASAAAKLHELIQGTGAIS